uniref:Uncharacterized protein n=1 Tax=Strongyloides venezuelensis TaxID=75913 RepID=A0A0K0FHG0_STRVS
MDVLNENINFNLENLIEQKVSSITDDVKAQEKVNEELLDSLFENKNESLSSTKIFEEVVGEITDSDDEFKAPLPVIMGTNKPFSFGHKRNARKDKLLVSKNFVKIKNKK